MTRARVPRTRATPRRAGASLRRTRSEPGCGRAEETARSRPPEMKRTGAVRESATDMARQDGVRKNCTSKARRTATNCAMRHVVLPLQQPLVRRQCCNTLASGVSFTWKNASHRSFTSRSSTRRSMRMVVLWSRRASELKQRLWSRRASRKYGKQRPLEAERVYSSTRVGIIRPSSK